MDSEKEYLRWLRNASEDNMEEALKSMREDEIEDSFYKNLSFGTGGLRGIIGAGTNRMNVYTVGKATQGVAAYLLRNYEVPSVVIGYDSRVKSEVFARTAACVFAANGVKVHIWSDIKSGSNGIFCYSLSESVSWNYNHCISQSGKI